MEDSLEFPVTICLGELSKMLFKIRLLQDTRQGII